MSDRFPQFFTYILQTPDDIRYSTYSIGFGVFEENTKTYCAYVMFNVTWIVFELKINSSNNMYRRVKYGANAWTEWTVM